MRLLDRVHAELAEPDLPQRPSYLLSNTISSFVGGTTRTATFNCPQGKERRLISAWCSGLLDATVSTRYFDVSLGGSTYTPAFSELYRCYAPYLAGFELTAGRGFQFSCIARASPTFSATALPIIGAVLPIPELWFDDRFAWSWHLNGSNANDTLVVNVLFEERARFV